MKNGFFVFNVKKYAVPPDQHVGDVSESGTCGTRIHILQSLLASGT